MRKTTVRVVQHIRKLIREWWALILLALLTAGATYAAEVTEEPAAIATMGWLWGLCSALWVMVWIQRWDRGG